MPAGRRRQAAASASIAAGLGGPGLNPRNERVSFDERWREATAPRASAGAALWLQSLRATAGRAWRHGDTNLAAALAFYAMLSFFPAAIVFVALVGLLGQYPQTVDALLRLIGRIAPASVVDAVQGPITSLIRNKGGAQALIGFGLLLALWAGSGYVGTFSWAANEVWGVREQRSYWLRLGLRMVVAAAMILVLALTMTVIVTSGPFLEWLGQRTGTSETLLQVWLWGRWPVFFLAAVFLFALLYYVGPDVRHRGVHWLAPGAFLGVIIWVAASVGFTKYLAHFHSYNKLYGSLTAIVVFLMWLWFLNLGLLFGAEFNAELAERRGSFESRSRTRRRAKRSGVAASADAAREAAAAPRQDEVRRPPAGQG